MTKTEEEMLEVCGGDMVVYNNWVRFADFICEMIIKYGDEVLAEIEGEKKQKELQDSDSSEKERH